MINNNWTTKNIPDLSGKIVVVTGGNSGLGLASSRAYAEKNASVIIACRSVERGEKSKKEILNDFPKANITVMELDLSNLWSVYMFASEFRKQYSHINILLNNAGIMMPPYSLTQDGVELQQSTNYFGHFALTALLLDLIAATPDARVVNLSSIAHLTGRLNFKNLLFEKGKAYTPYKAYSRSKLECLMFTFELQRYFKANNIDAKAIAAHPGVSYTNLFSKSAPSWVRAMIRPLFKRFSQPASMGALPQLRASVDPTAQGGEFYGPNGFLQIKGHPVKVKAKSYAYRTDYARKLWEQSELITGIAFDYVPPRKINVKSEEKEKMVV